MKKEAVTTVIMAVFLASIASIPTAMAHTQGDPFTTPLIAGGGNPKSAIDVGDVLVWNDAEFLIVKYVITDTDWCLAETHLHVDISLDGIPQKNGNPIPGHFHYLMEHDCVTEYAYAIPLTWDPCTEVYIAAHAVVQTSNVEITCLEDETAWGAGDDFPGANWATYFTYHVQPYEVLWPEGGTATIAFEDLPIGEGNDYDYNNFVTDVSVVGTYSYMGLTELKFTFEAQARGAAYHHDLFLFIEANTFDSSGIYTITLYETDGSMLISMAAPFDNTLDFDRKIFADTWLALPPNPGQSWSGNTFDASGVQAGRMTVITFEFDTAFAFDLSTYTPEYVGVHGDNLFFDPYLHVWDTGEDIHITDPRLIVVPTDWEWPQETAAVWTVYPYNTVTGQGVTAGNPPTFTTYWYTETPTGSKWTP